MRITFAIIVEKWGARDIEMICKKCKNVLQFIYEDGQGKFICPECGHEENVEHCEVTI